LANKRVKTKNFDWAKKVFKNFFDLNAIRSKVEKDRKFFCNAQRMHRGTMSRIHLPEWTFDRENVFKCISVNSNPYLNPNSKLNPQPP